MNFMHEEPDETLWTMCKSGKDRTFAMLVRNAAVIFGKANKEKTQKIAIAMAHSNHAETMASGVGGTRGAVGLKLGAALTGIKFMGKIFPARLSGDEILGGEVKQHWENDISYVNNWEKVVPKKQESSVEKFINNSFIDDDELLRAKAKIPNHFEPKMRVEPRDSKVNQGGSNIVWGITFIATIALVMMIGPVGLIIGPMLGYLGSQLIANKDQKKQEDIASYYKNTPNKMQQNSNSSIDHQLKTEVEQLMNRVSNLENKLNNKSATISKEQDNSSLRK